MFYNPGIHQFSLLRVLSKKIDHGRLRHATIILINFINN